MIFSIKQDNISQFQQSTNSKSETMIQNMKIIFNTEKYQNYMSRYRSSLSKLNSSSITNPQIPINQVLKMQDLLEEYDRQNQFLNKQVLELLSRNRVLQKTNTYNAKEKPSLRNRLQERENANEGRRKKAYEYLRQLDKSKSPIKNNYDRKKQNSYPVQSRYIDEEDDKNRNKEGKQVKFTKDPYIEVSDVRTISPQKRVRQQVDEENSPLKRKSILRRSGINVVSRSGSKEKQFEKNDSPKKQQTSVKDKQQDKQIQMFESKLSLKSSQSRKSGIEVVSSEKKQKKQNQSEQKVNLMLTSQKNKLQNNQSLRFSSQFDQNKSTLKKSVLAGESKEIKNEYIKNIGNNIGEQVKLPIVPITPERKSNLQRVSMGSITIGNYSNDFAGNTSEDQMNRTHTQIAQRFNYMRRSQSQHKIQPSNNTNYEKNIMQRQGSRSSAQSKSKTGKFLNVVTKDLIKEKLGK